VTVSDVEIIKSGKNRNRLNEANIEVEKTAAFQRILVQREGGTCCLDVQTIVPMTD
jgi:hypothetical protein